MGACVHARGELARIDEDGGGADEDIQGLAVEGLRTTKPPKANSAEGEKGQGWKLP